MRVRNLNSAPQMTCSSSDWLRHWEKCSGQTAYQCFVSGCRGRRSVAGLVQKPGANDAGWYVVPLCEECNKRTGEDLEIWDLARLVPVNVAKSTRMAAERSPNHAPRAAGSVS